MKLFASAHEPKWALAFLPPITVPSGQRFASCLDHIYG